MSTLGLAALMMIYFLITLAVISHYYKHFDDSDNNERFGRLAVNMKIENKGCSWLVYHVFQLRRMIYGMIPLVFSDSKVF
jgi:hypothetical protein